MRLLVNYDKGESNYLSILQYYIKREGYEAVATSATLSIGELVAKAQSAKCQGIFLCNAETLANCVPGTSPSLDDWRGSLLSFSVPTIVGNSLLHANTIPYGGWLLGKDLARFKVLKDISKNQEFNYTVLETVDMFFDAYNDLSTAEFISYDIETKTINGDETNNRAGDTIITCCSWTACYADKSLRTYVLPLVNFLQDHWLSDIDYGRAISLLRQINALEIPKAMHRGMYDAMHSIIYQAEPAYWVLDTMAMTHCEFSEIPKDLSFVASITDNNYCQWKGEAEAAAKEQDIRRYWAYNAKDSWQTARIVLYYLDKLPAYARKNYQAQFKLVYPALYCNFEGFLIDQNKRTEIREKEAIRQAEALSRLRISLADPKFNPGSWQQVAKYLYDILGAADPKIGKKRDSKTGKKTQQTRGTNEKNLLAAGQQHPILLRITDAIINYRKAQKAVSTYMDFLQKNARLLWELDPFGTESERMACTASSLWCGTQVQNIPSYAKPMLIADEGFILVEIDNSQSEARCTAYLSQDLKLIAALEDKTKDFYTTLGFLFFSIPYEKVTKEFRNKILKKIVHGTNYMMGAQTFVENAGAQNLLDATAQLNIKVTMDSKPKTGWITLKQFAQVLLDSYHVPFFRVKEWYQEIKQEIITTKKLKSPLGHVRYFFGDVAKSHTAFNSAVAHAPQNLSVSILNIGFWKVWQLVKKHKGKLRLKAQIHDSILAQYKIEQSEIGQSTYIKNDLIQAMNNPIKVHNRTMLIPTDCKIGTSWGSMKELPREV